MNGNIQLMTTSEYGKLLRPFLPVSAFRPDRTVLWKVVAHLSLIAGTYVCLRELSSTWMRPAASALIGHSLACLAFVAHDVSHQSVVKNRLVRRLLELVLWGLNLVPPTLWRKLHNQQHHVETNTLSDTDRPFLRAEETNVTKLYTRAFFPNRSTPYHHPFVLFHFVTYIVRHLVTALGPGASKPSVVTFKPCYTGRAKLNILLELAVIVAAQGILWLFLRGSLWDYFWASPAAILVTSSVVMIYIFTNHFLNPLCEHTDPLVGSTSVIVPRWMDWLHDNFSYHTEHHVFPSMNPKFYPEVSRLLQEHFPDRYNRIPLREAWRRLWLRDEFIDESRDETPTQQ